MKVMFWFWDIGDENVSQAFSGWHQHVTGATFGSNADGKWINFPFIWLNTFSVKYSVLQFSATEEIHCSNLLSL